MIKFIRNYPKLFLSIVLTTLLAVYVISLRLPQAVDCSVQSLVRQSVPWDKWRYNWFIDECQYNNDIRWIPLQRVLDVGSGDVEEVEE